jgi:hypothetical protein
MPSEEIQKVILYKAARQNDSISRIVGMQFRTTKGRRSILFGSDDGKWAAESFAGYTFGYAKGRRQDYQWINMLQFVWFKSTAAARQLVECKYRLPF